MLYDSLFWTPHKTQTHTHNTQHTIAIQLKLLVQQVIILQNVADRCDCESSMINIVQGNIKKT